MTNQIDNAKNFLDLPSEIRRMVFELCPKDMFSRVYSVCRDWQRDMKGIYESDGKKLKEFLSKHCKRKSSKRIPNPAELSLAYKSISTIPETIYLCKNLLTLNLSSNLLTELPEELRCCFKLSVVKLQNNQFSTIPPVLLDLEHLKELNLGDNPLNDSKDNKETLLALQDKGVKVSIESLEFCKSGFNPFLGH